MKISIENYDKIYTTFVNHEDCSIDEYIDIFANLLIANGFQIETIRHAFKEWVFEKENI